MGLSPRKPGRNSLIRVTHLSTRWGALHRVGEMLSSNDPTILQRGAAMIASNPKLMRTLQAADEAVSKIGGVEAGSAPILAAPNRSPLQTLQTGEAPAPVNELAERDDLSGFVAARQAQDRVRAR